MKVKDLINILNGKPLNISDLYQEVSSFSIDSRKVSKNSFFIPLKGKNLDGHLFIEDAIKKGATGYISEKPLNLPGGILVNDTYSALIKIAKFKRKSLQTVIGITGTSGKTTTKELLKIILSQFYNTYATEGNLNNEIGLPLSLSNTPPETDIAILEMGAGKIGDIRYLSDIADHDIGVITSLGYGHTEKFGSFENVIKGKGEIFEKAKYAVLPEEFKNKYSELLKYKSVVTFGKNGDIGVENVYIDNDGTTGEILYKNKRVKLKIPVFNKSIFNNIGAVSGVLLHLGIDPIEPLGVLKDYRPLKGRGNTIKKRNLLIIDDTYNANPLSVENAIKTLSGLKGKKILVLGDMLELGKYSEELHRKIGRIIRKSSIDTPIFHGEFMKYAYLEAGRGYFFEKKEEIVEKIQNITKDERATVLIKGSRGMKMEDIVDMLSSLNT